MLDWLAHGLRLGHERQRPMTMAKGLIAGTLVGTAEGWRRVEDLRPGDLLVTFDNGLQPLVAVERALYPNPAVGFAGAEPLLQIPAGLIGNRRSMLVPRDQVVIMESDLSEELHGDPFAPIYACALDNMPGVSDVMPEEGFVMVTLSFEAQQIVFAEGNALILCSAAVASAPQSLDEAVFGSEETSYRVLSEADARLLAGGLLAMSHGLAQPVDEALSQQISA